MTLAITQYPRRGWLSQLGWRAVWWWKHRTGYVDMGVDVAATGEVVWVEGSPAGDGDLNFAVALDAGQEWLVTGLGGRLTTPRAGLGPSILCEVPPWLPDDLRRRCATLAVGDRVRVMGRWGFDGVHVGVAEWLETLLALWRHQPNLRDGWFEIHPVMSVELVD